MPELWRPIPGFKNYEASDQGNIRSIDRIQHFERLISGKVRLITRKQKGYVLKPNTTCKAPFYKRVVLIRDCEKHYRSVHRLVCEAFHGPAPEGMICCHINDVAHDNRPENLKWDTPSANNYMAIANGRINRRK